MKTKLLIEIDAEYSYTTSELEKISEQICNFLAGPHGNGIKIDDVHTERTFQILDIKISKPKEKIWGSSFLRNRG